MVDIGGYKVLLKCTGKGSPVVILESGWGSGTKAWENVQPEVSNETCVCSYDRVGVGKSDKPLAERTSQQISDDLYHLLDYANIKGPYVLVGQAFGGLNVRLFASQHPESVAGMILIDSSHEEQNVRTREVYNEEQRKELDQQLASVKDRDPEKLNMDKSFAQVKAANWKQDIPLLVITHGKEPATKPQSVLNDEQRNKISEMIKDMQKELVTRSPQGRQLIAQNSFSMIQRDQPELIIGAIIDMVNAIRDKK